MTKIDILAAGLAFLMVAAPASAAQVTSKDPASIVRAMQTAGFQAKLDKSDNGDPMIESGAAGRKFWVYFNNCEKNKDCATVQFFTWYKTDDDKTPPLAKLNEWHNKKRFAFAYLDKDGDPCLQMDLNLEPGGMSDTLFLDNLSIWSSLMGDFEKHIGL